MLRSPLLFLGLCAGCESASSGRIEEASVAHTPVQKRPPGPQQNLPERWDSMAPWDFEQALAGLTTGTWSAPHIEFLGAKLEAPGSVSIRAAVLLAHGDQAAGECMLTHLERRREEPERSGDAAEIIAAAGLVAIAEQQSAPNLFRDRLRDLAIGQVPHPDLEIRVECAVSALDLGERAVVPFLLRVLHAGTPQQARDPIDWTPSETMAWSKGRASGALSRAAGIPNHFRADGPWASQAAQADEFAQVLRPGLGGF